MLLILIVLCIVLIFNNKFVMHLRLLLLNQIFFSDRLHVCWVDHYQLLSLVRLCNDLHWSVADHLVLKELQFLLLLKFLQSSRSQLILLKVWNFHRFNFAQQDWESEIVILIIFQWRLELAILAAVFFALNMIYLIKTYNLLLIFSKHRTFNSKADFLTKFKSCLKI